MAVVWLVAAFTVVLGCNSFCSSNARALLEPDSARHSKMQVQGSTQSEIHLLQQDDVPSIPVMSLMASKLRLRNLLSMRKQPPAHLATRLTLPEQAAGRLHHEGTFKV